jgi:two-component system, OmpR family, sensor histidine kinase KdpD
MGGAIRPRASSDSRRPWLQWMAWLGVLAIITLGMLAVRIQLDRAHVVLIYLLVVLGASSRGGRPLGMTVAITAFLAVNFFFIPPFHTLAIAEPLDLLVLVSFLVTAVVAAQLLAKARNEASAAMQRAAEIDHLASIGAETLNAGRAEESLAAIAEVIRATLGVARCEIHLRTDVPAPLRLAAESGVEPPTSADAPAYTGARLVDWVGANGRPAAEREDGTIRFGAGMGSDEPALDLAGVRSLLVPLRVRDRTAGVLRIAHSSGITLDRAQQRFLDALSYYAALGADRVRLVAAAERTDALRQADQLKDALLVSVSHDLRTPLTTIKALAHDIGAEGDERAMTIEEEADRLNRFVANLLDLSRLSGGTFTVTPELNAAEDLIGAALQSVGGPLEARTLNASLDPAEPVLVGRFDFVHALRALVNLIENALKYSSASSPVDLSVRRAGNSLEFVVADRGPGVPVAERARIFEPFYRPPGSPPDAGSAGLGLSIVRRIAEAQGGSVAFEPRDGGGSRFILRLPAADVSELQLASSHSPSRESL